MMHLQLQIEVKLFTVGCPDLPHMQGTTCMGSLYAQKSYFFRQLCRSWLGDKKLPAYHLDCPLKQASCEEADYCVVVKNALVCLLLLAQTVVWVTQEAKQSSGRGPVKVPLMGEGG